MREALGGVGLGIGPWHDVQRFDAVLQRPDRGAQMRGAVLGQAAEKLPSVVVEAGGAVEMPVGAEAANRSMGDGRPLASGCLSARDVSFEECSPKQEPPGRLAEGLGSVDRRASAAG